MFETEPQIDNEQEAKELLERLGLFKSKHKEWLEDEMTKVFLKVALSNLEYVRETVCSGDFLTSKDALSHYARYVGNIDSYDKVVRCIKESEVLFNELYFGENK